jgi:hypothetical protein
VTLKEFTAYQPICDIDGCGFILIGDVEFWHTAPEDAAEQWREYEGWTDGSAWICEKHLHEPHAFVGKDLADECDRCKVERDEHEEPEVSS